MSSTVAADLPGWQLRCFDEIAHVNPESLSSGTPPDLRFRYIDISSVEKGSVRWDTVREEIYRTAPSRARRIVREGDVLFGTVRPALQSHAYIDRASDALLVASTGFAVIRAEADVSAPRFLYHCVLGQGVFAQARKLEVGSNYPAVNESDVARMNLLVPPVPEQSAIAAILDTVDKAILETERLIAKLQHVKQGVVHDVLTRGIDKNSELRDPERCAEQFKQSPLGWVPKDWSISSVGDQFELQLGKMLSQKAHQGRGARPYLNNKAVQWDRVDVSDLPVMDFSRSEQQRFSLRPGDLLVCEGGEVGRTALWRGELTGCCFQKAIHRLRATQGYEPRLMLRYMKFAADMHRFADLTSQSSIAHLTKEKLTRLPIPVPPRDEQVRAANAFDAIDDRIDLERADLGKLRAIKAGLTDDLLTGRVRFSLQDGVAA